MTRREKQDAWWGQLPTLAILRFWRLTGAEHFYSCMGLDEIDTRFPELGAKMRALVDQDRTFRRFAR